MKIVNERHLGNPEESLIRLPLCVKRVNRRKGLMMGGRASYNNVNMVRRLTNALERAWRPKEKTDELVEVFTSRSIVLSSQAAEATCARRLSTVLVESSRSGDCL